MLLKLRSLPDTPVVKGGRGEGGGWFALSFDSNRTSTSQRFLWVNCLSPSKSEVNQRVGCQNPLPSLVSLICLLNCATLYQCIHFIIPALLCNKNYPTLWNLPCFVIPLAPLCNTEKLHYFVMTFSLHCNISKLPHFIITLVPREAVPIFSLNSCSELSRKFSRKLPVTESFF